MAIYYVDITNGNSTNSGTSWADAVEWIDDILDSLLDNDEVRISKTPDAISIGNALFTKHSNVVELSSPRTTHIDTAEGDTWSGVTNVSLGSYTTNRKYGSSSQYLLIQNSEVIDKVGWKTISSTLDLSAYSKVSFMISVSNTTSFNSSEFRLCLCSDINGDVIVDDLAISNISVANRGIVLELDNGSSLSNTINSVALYRTNSGTTNFIVRINHIFATDDISLTTLIGISNDNGYGPIWYPILNIDGTTVNLDIGGLSTSSNSQGYFVDETDTYEAFIRQTYVPKTSVISYPSDNINVLYTFGVNPNTDIDDGLTILDFKNMSTNTLSGDAIVTFKNLIMFRAYSLGCTSSTSKRHLIFNECYFISPHFSQINALSFNATAYILIDVMFICIGNGVSGYVFYNAGNNYSFSYHAENVTLINSLGKGFVISSNGSYFKNLKIRGYISQQPLEIDGIDNIVDTFENLSIEANRYDGKGGYNKIYNYISGITLGNLYPGYKDHIESDDEITTIKGGNTWQHSVKSINIDTPIRNQIENNFAMSYKTDLQQPDGTIGVWTYNSSSYPLKYKTLLEKVFIVSEVYIESGTTVLAKISHTYIEDYSPDYFIRFMARAKDSYKAITVDYETEDTGSTSWKEMSISFLAENDGLVRFGISGGGSSFIIANFSIITS